MRIFLGRNAAILAVWASCLIGPVSAIQEVVAVPSSSSLSTSLFNSFVAVDEQHSEKSRDQKTMAGNGDGSGHRFLQIQPCGELQCRNGGKCGDNHNYHQNKPLCDCSTAIQVTGNEPHFEPRFFVGKECEIEVVDYCAGNNDLFCVNNGTCRVRAQNFKQVPCDCPAGYDGRHCEYKSEDLQLECSLTCSLHGHCEHGFSPRGGDDPKGVDSVIPAMDRVTNNFMHCVCDKGYAGPNCEYDYIKCDTKGMYCFHGSSCTMKNDEEVCECGVVGGAKLSGDYCEYKATDHCDNPKDLLQAPNSFDAANQMNSSLIPFCVNDGVCYKDAEKDGFYCSCENGYTGIRCEKKVPTTVAPHASPAPSAAWTDTWAPTVMASVTDKPVMTSSAPQQPTPKPTWKPTPAPVRSSIVASASEGGGNEDSLQPAGKFGVIFGGMIGFVFLLFILHYVASDDDGIENQQGVENYAVGDSEFAAKDAALISEDGTHSIQSETEMSDIPGTKLKNSAGTSDAPIIV